jgi:hypothetical protein
MKLALKTLLAIGMAAGVGLLSVGCGGGGAGGGSGSVSVALADAPDPSATAVNVTIDRVEANVNGTWTPITSGTPAFSGNLLTLASTDKLLGTTSLPTGHYTQVRLFVSSATVTDSTGTHDVTIPSGSQTGLKVLVDFDINANNVTTILLDFDVSHSLIQTGAGAYMLKPVVRGVVQVLSGTITGTVVDASGPVMNATVTITPTGAQPSSTDPSTLTQADGTFKMWGVMPGSYTVNVTFTPSGGTAETGSAANEVVTADANTDAGTITLG